MRLTVAYGRVSTSSGEQLSALDVQLSWLQAQGADVILSDVESGRVIARPNYQQLKAMVAAGRVGRVIATALSRLGRDAAESDAFVRLCDEHGTSCLTRDDGQLTMATPEDLLLTRLKGSLSQGESMRIQQRVLRGLEQGRAIGKPMRKPCWGYQLRADRMAFEPHPVEFVRAQRFIRHLQAGRWRMATTLQEHRDLAPFSSCRGVRAWLLNPTLRGGIGYHQRANHSYERVMWGRHQALLTHAEFAEFERVTSTNRLLWGHNSATIPRLLTGLVECSECGCRLKYISGRTVASLKCSGTLCSQLYKGTREDAIVRYAITELSQRAADRLAATVHAEEPPEARELRQAIAALTALGDPDLATVIDTKEQRLVLLLQRPEIDEGLVRKLSDRRWFDLATADELREILQALVERVTVTRQEPTAIRLRL
ncbi:MAG: recombinase family protein [Synechococcus sp. ELA057]|jgi:DNA invertase Pin-like site-specific DNA recombinase